jgi:hypothetical protein
VSASSDASNCEIDDGVALKDNIKVWYSNLVNVVGFDTVLFLLFDESEAIIG